MALAALALAATGRDAEAEPIRRKLAEGQAADGSLGITATEPSPKWPTGWAVLAWTCAGKNRPDASLRPDPRPPNPDPRPDPRDACRRAIDWLLSAHGHTWQRTAELGHDPSIDGWPWVEGTHPWIEPTAISLLALRAAGLTDHPRAREAARLLVDRLLPDGGCNYGNTSVFGQTLRPHVQPTGLALIALAGNTDTSGKIERSLAYLERTLPTTVGGESLAYGVMALTAHRRRPRSASQWLAVAQRKTTARFSAPRQALLTLAGCEDYCPLLPHDS
jgi:hypothetical protein